MPISNHPFLNNLLLIFGSTLLTVGLLEFVFRSIDYDFSHQFSLFGPTPHQLPATDSTGGAGVFGRDGSAIWRGHVLSKGLRAMGGLDPAYNDGPIETICSNQLGFRISDDFLDWDIVVVGDPFVELGYLPYESLFTTLIGKALHTEM